jgi:hypothetical protein
LSEAEIKDMTKKLYLAADNRATLRKAMTVVASSIAIGSSLVFDPVALRHKRSGDGPSMKVSKHFAPALMQMGFGAPGRLS